MMLYLLWSGGYYFGKCMSVEMIEEFFWRVLIIGMDDEKFDIMGSVGNVGIVMSVDVLFIVEL